MNSIAKPLVVDIWSDFVCPWCWIAKRRFEQALAEFEHKDLVRVNQRAYRIAQHHPAEPFETALVKKFGNPAAAQGMMDSVKRHAAAEGLDYRFDTMLFGDTTDAHMLVKAVHDGPLQRRLVEALYEQGTTHGKSLFDRESLALIAVQVGVPPDTVQTAWAQPELRQLVQQDERTATHIASGVPLFAFSNGTHVSGAQAKEVFRQALEQLYAQSPVGIESSNGRSCDLDGCRI